MEAVLSAKVMRFTRDGIALARLSRRTLLTVTDDLRNSGSLISMKTFGDDASRIS